MKKQKPKQITRQDLVNERNKLLVSGDNPERLKEITKKINYIDYGITEKNCNALHKGTV